MIPKLAFSVVVAAVVAGVALVSDVGVVVAVVAALAAVVAFWIFDAFSGDVAPSRPGGTASIAPSPMPAAAPVSTQRGARLDPALFDPSSIEVRSEAGGRRAFALRVAKHGHRLADCEDAVQLDPSRAVMAVADGASSSFGAHLWADTLTRCFVQRPPAPLSIPSFAAWLAETRVASPASAPAPSAPAAADPNGWWSEQGERDGAYSTIVGASVHLDGAQRVVTVMCLGDSSAFVVGGPPGARRLRRALPYEDASQFGSHPALLGSAAGRAHDEPIWTVVPAEAGDLVVLASDAVAEWLLADPQRFAIVDGAEPATIAAQLVAERTDGRIVNDDLTFALLELA